MSRKNISIDKIIRGETINSPDGQSYTAKIQIEPEDDNFIYQYAIIESGSEHSEFIPWTSSKGFTEITHKNLNPEKIKTIIFKSENPLNAIYSIEVDPFYDVENPSEQIDNLPRVRFPRRYIQNEETNSDDDIWYKDPWILGAIFIVAILLFMMMSKNSNSYNMGGKGGSVYY